MNKQQAIALLQAMYANQEIDADDYEIGLLGIQYAEEQAQSHADEQREDTV